ncbi:putative ATP-dependent RNA helicase DHX33 isoform X2 [Cimex lectularius]|uniref:RNA helicase n=1 Tax=Cimex lectularius TaxID=79782 RepID=A0A8I6SN88_CIMLE|nr:putative ATP-dependent RNA helicase DHX33 isoform X2 [Cimex lectularius]
MNCAWKPRRVAAITVANRVALEAKTSIGQIVGYCVRFEDNTSDMTKIKYMTDGMLLREALLDEYLLAYNVIILDEAHERTIHTDVLFGIVKAAQKQRAAKLGLRPLKVIVMSATMDVDHFCQYFDNAPAVYLEGRQYPVEINHAIEPQDDYIFSSLVTIFQIHKEAPPNHDILVFLTGQEEIESMTANIRAIQKDELCVGPNIRVFPLYAALCSNKQMEIFQPCNPNTRKIILSTNIAETSVTISGIKYVIDSGMVKQKIHHPATGLDILKVLNISQAQAWQRTGRAGRESEGFCYRIYTKEEYDGMLPNSVPEILRSNLSSVILQLLALKVNLLKFDFLDKPPTELIFEGLDLLKLLEAIDDVKDPNLTDLGKQMSLFPLDPRYSKILISAKTFGCIEEVLTIIAILSGETIFVNNVAKREEAAAARAKFSSSSGDLITLLNVFRAYNSVSSKHAWCYENFLISRNLEYASKVRKQLADICQKCNMQLTTCGEDVDRVKKCFISGFFMNLAELQRDRKYVTVGKRQIVSIHPSSVLSGTYPQLILFTELVQTNKCYMRYVTPVDPQWVEEISPKGYKCVNISEVD